MKHLVHLILALCLGSAAALAQAPAISQGGILNGASFATGQPVQAGGLVSIFGTNLASGLTQDSSVPLSTTLGQTSVTFNNLPAPLYFVSAGQINAQIPWELASSQSANVVVTNNGASSAAAMVQLTAAAPGIFVTGSNQAIAYGNSDYAFAAPNGAIPAVCGSCAASHPAKIGDPTTLVILATGLGPLNTPVPDGAGVPPSAAFATTTVTPTVTVGNVPAQVVYSGTSGYVGVYQLNIVIQPGTPTGDGIPIVITMNGIKSNGPTISVSN
ncbi:MAG TPA: IPT/TIG domain-containing protein [Verrucomicrobiae bacterium]|nr:IPT/TIG domain-containing protein [Verrucomicrobiae bacterium]